MKRYDLDWMGGQMFEDENGEYVEYLEYEKIEAETKRLKEENARFREALEKIAHCDDLTISGEYDGTELARRLRFAVNVAENAQMTQAVKTEARHAS